ncbi:aquaporin [Candidatus Saccharibacteria bacterium]|nr:aquaporin [Candidatus Saccharibacteria bacterium]
MAKSKKSSKKPTEKPASEKKATKSEKTVAEKTAKTEKVVKTVKTEKEPIVSEKKGGFWKEFFAKKYEENESILTIFKQKKIYGALIAEVLGTMFVALVVMTLGLYQPLYMFFIVMAVVAAMYRLSGANLNPINTIGMMVTRRMSAIRGVLYLLAQVVGAWLGVLVVTAFAKASGPDVEMAGMTMVDNQYYWVVTLVEFLGATIVGFFFARAQEYRKSALTFAAVVAGGVLVATVVAYLTLYNYFGLTGTFMMNPAMALMYQILPTSADTVGGLLLEIGKALLTYVVLPMVGGVIGFGLSDASKQLVEE